MLMQNFYTSYEVLEKPAWIKEKVYANRLTVNTFNGENANVTIAFEPKLVRTARLIPFPLVLSGNISDTISQLIGPKDICNGI